MREKERKKERKRGKICGPPLSLSFCKNKFTVSQEGVCVRACVLESPVPSGGITRVCVRAKRISFHWRRGKKHQKGETRREKGALSVRILRLVCLGEEKDVAVSLAQWLPHLITLYCGEEMGKSSAIAWVCLCTLCPYWELLSTETDGIENTFDQEVLYILVLCDIVWKAEYFLGSFYSVRSRLENLTPSLNFFRGTKLGWVLVAKAGKLIFRRISSQARLW